MKFKKFLQILALAVSGTLALDLGIWGTQYLKRQSVEIIKEGEISKLTDKDILTYDVLTCSAVAFDFGERAIMAHAVPLMNMECDCVIGTNKPVNAETVADYLVKESEKYGLDSKKSRVFISACDEKSLELITNSLAGKGIPVQKASARFKTQGEAQFITNPYQVIRYRPSKDKLEVFNQDNFHDYRIIFDLR